MKIFTVMFCLLLSVNAWGQNKNTIHTDTSTNKIDLGKQLAQAVNMTNATFGRKPLLIVDGDRYSGNVKDFKSADIESIQILSAASAKTIYADEGRGGAILITTRQYKVDSYKNELTYLSKSYRKFTREHEDNSHITYRLNGMVLKGDKYAVANKLFNIPEKDIKWIRVKKYRISNGDAAIVSIRTYHN
jgi:hypothetical protein